MKTTVGDIMAKNVRTIDIYSTVQEAERIMEDENYRHIEVTEEGKLAGIITMKKIMEYKLRELYDGKETFFMEDRILDFEKILKRDPSIIYEEDSLEKAVNMMINKRIDYIPVVDWEKNIVGSLSFTDILLFVNEKIQDGVL